jgi:DegV family protein with EDD domain
MARVAIVTDSAADLTPADARAAGITVVPLEVTFGTERFRAGVDLTTEEFWARMLAPEAPFPTTAAASPGDFRDAFEACFAAGAEAIVCVDVAETLSGTIRSARIAREMLPGREIEIVDSRTASMGVGLLALLAAELAAAGRSAPEIASAIEQRRDDIDLYVALDTLEYLRKGGRISGAQAAIGGLLSVKPIITVREGLVVTADRVRTRSRARERCLELLTARPAERVSILHTMAPDVEAFRAELIRRMPGGIDPARVSIQPVGPSVGPHLGPGCLGGVVLLERSAPGA